MTKLEEQLSCLVKEACRHRPGSAQRQKNLTQIIRLVKDKLWRENIDHYEDALQQTWVYFCQNICEGKTGEPYDPTRSTIVTWLNFYLKRRLQDFYIERRKQQERISARLPRQQEEVIDPVETIPASPDVPPLLDNVRTWVETDLTGELRRLHIENHPEVTAQLLILRRLPPETSWKDLSAELGLPISTLSSFYQRRCLPCLRKFGESEGYL